MDDLIADLKSVWGIVLSSVAAVMFVMGVATRKLGAKFFVPGVEQALDELKETVDSASAKVQGGIEEVRVHQAAMGRDLSVMANDLKWQHELIQAQGRRIEKLESK